MRFCHSAFLNRTAELVRRLPPFVAVLTPFSRVLYRYVDVLELGVHVRYQTLHEWLTPLKYILKFIMTLVFHLHSFQYKTSKLATPHHVLMAASASTLVITTAANVRVDTMEGSVSTVCFGCCYCCCFPCVLVKPLKPLMCSKF